MQPGASGQEKAQKETTLQQFQCLPKSLCCVRKDLKSRLEAHKHQCFITCKKYPQNSSTMTKELKGHPLFKIRKAECHYISAIPLRESKQCL